MQSLSPKLIYIFSNLVNPREDNFTLSNHLLKAWKLTLQNTEAQQSVNITICQLHGLKRKFTTSSQNKKRKEKYRHSFTWLASSARVCFRSYDVFPKILFPVSLRITPGKLSPSWLRRWVCSLLNISSTSLPAEPKDDRHKIIWDREIYWREFLCIDMIIRGGKLWKI